MRDGSNNQPIQQKNNVAASIQNLNTLNLININIEEAVVGFFRRSPHQESLAAKTVFKDSCV